jgi:hypothetical protein
VGDVMKWAATELHNAATMDQAGHLTLDERQRRLVAREAARAKEERAAGREVRPHTSHTLQCDVADCAERVIAATLGGLAGACYAWFISADGSTPDLCPGHHRQQQER